MRDFLHRYAPEKPLTGGILQAAAGVAAALWLASSPALAAPFEKTFTFVQPGGVAITLCGWGDEFYAVFETPAGYTVLFDRQKGAYVYARLSDDGTSLTVSDWLVGATNPETLGLAPHLREGPDRVREQAAARSTAWKQATLNAQRWPARKSALLSLAAAGTNTIACAPPSFTVTGTKVGLTLLIDFDDDTGTVARAEIANFCNGDAYSGFGNNGSVKKYFSDNSNGLLLYTNIVTAYVRIPNSLHPKSYYNNTSSDCGNQANLLIKDALDILKAQPNYASEIAPAFSNLTRDASGYVAAFNVFYAGDNGGVWAYGLWPHSWSLYNVGAQTLVTGVVAYDYQITDIGSSLELGTFCHENGHMLCGYPDLYDYGYDSVGGAGLFCLMGYGGSGVNPVQISAYLKRASGWATTTELASNSVLTAAVSSAGTNYNHFYRYAKPGTPTEYYLVENRQKTGRDANIRASGIAVWHVDELGDRDNQRYAYNTTHANYELTLVQADNLWHFENYANYGDANDLFFSGNSAAAYSNLFSDVSAPSARWWDGSVSGVSFGGFSASGTNMSFSVAPPALTLFTPSVLPNATVGLAYTQALEAFGGTPPYA